ncbi:PEPxxWA-CTERM sorting domain-containing protein [Sphingomonas sp.]|uniref:PEPxxWA-CTERM sorting domain-containing protein n=1 Tax=Sphingomonas sp. TaxID=28214 RepID=UPI003CC679EB
MMKKYAVAAIGLMVAAPAAAQTVDGVRDASYGVAKSFVAYDPNAPTNNFGTPGPTNASAAYSIYLTAGTNAVYGFFQADRNIQNLGVAFANLYFDVDPANNNGSDVGFEITNRRAFAPGVNGYSATLPGINYAFSADGTGLEFSIANSYFTGPIAGLTYADPNQQFAAANGAVTLRISQSFGYSAAGGATYGNNRLGSVNLVAAPVAAVPEPATWAMLIMGFALAGFALRRRAAAPRTTVRFA